MKKSVLSSILSLAVTSSFAMSTPPQVPPPGDLSPTQDLKCYYKTKDGRICDEAACYSLREAILDNPDGLTVIANLCSYKKIPHPKEGK